MVDPSNTEIPKVYFYDEQNKDEEQEQDDIPEGRYGEEPYASPYIDPDAVLPPPSDLLIGDNDANNNSSLSNEPNNSVPSESRPKGS